MHRHFCIIPCRKGSKSIKDKNLQKLAGKTLVRLAVDAAQNAKFFEGIIITTDYYRGYLELPQDSGYYSTKIFFHKRPNHLCTDTTDMKDVIRDAISSVGGKAMNWVWVLQPTSPFRRQSDFKAIKEAVETGEYSSAISFKPVDDHPNRCYTVKDGQAHPLRYVNYDNKQGLRTIVTRSGNFYVFNKEKFLEKDKVEIKPFYSHFMGDINPECCSSAEIEWAIKCGCNIDGPRHWEDAKLITQRGEFRLK